MTTDKQLIDRGDEPIPKWLIEYYKRIPWSKTDEGEAFYNLLNRIESIAADMRYLCLKQLDAPRAVGARNSLFRNKSRQLDAIFKRMIVICEDGRELCAEMFNKRRENDE